MAFAAAAAVAFGFAATPASAAIELASSNLECDLLTGCIFNGNDNDNSATDIEQAYNDDHVEGPGPATLELGEFIGKIEGITAQSYPWNLSSINDWDGTAAAFVIVKSAGQFKLFQLAAPATSGNASGFIPQGGPGEVKDISHLSFYAGVAVVPEPGAWALMILGFGAAGWALRRRRAVIA